MKKSKPPRRRVAKGDPPSSYKLAVAKAQTKGVKIARATERKYGLAPGTVRIVTTKIGPQGRAKLEAAQV